MLTPYRRTLRGVAAAIAAAVNASLSSGESEQACGLQLSSEPQMSRTMGALALNEFNGTNDAAIVSSADVAMRLTGGWPRGNSRPTSTEYCP